MDKPIDPGIKRKKRLIRYAIAGTALLAVLFYCLHQNVGSQVQVDQTKITRAKVKKDIFQDEIAVLGAVEPIQTVFLDATEGGRVEEIFIREGAAVKKGDPILRITNDKLLLEISSYETEVARAVNDLKSLRVTMENQLYNNQSQLVQYYYDLCKLGRDVTNNEQLVQTQIISQDDRQTTRENYDRKQKLYELLAIKSVLDSNSMTARITASEESVESMQRNLAINRSRLDKLTIKAPVDGELATLNPELGQVIAYGAPIGTINILDAYKLRADVDEHFISRVKLKLQASCEFSGQEYPAAVSKIYPEVKSGKFSVNLVFSGKVPPEIRIGQTSRIRLELGQSQTAILIPRGGFYSSTGGQWIYVVNPQTQIAIKRNIRIGRQNPAFYEVLEGLEPGEEAITSGYETLGNMEKILLK
ncbi:MAG: efflux RND transporter periplasmic adaptor subunit [Verrucomicrobiota bacterium]